MEIRLIEAGTFPKGKFRFQYVSKAEERMVGTQMTFPLVHKWHVAECVLSHGLSCKECGEFDSRTFRLETEHVSIPEFNEDFEAALLGPKPLPKMSDDEHKLQTLSGLWYLLRGTARLPIPLIKSRDIPRLTAV